MSRKTYALAGAAGYIAPRHMQAISETNGELVAAHDPNDSVGVIDRYFPQAAFFTEFERFDRHIDKLRRTQKPIDALAVCSPNYLHDAHIRFGLRSGLDVICEKPLVLNPWNVDALNDLQMETGKQVFTILQLRLHPNVIALREKVKQNPDKVFDVDLTYITPRGYWYYASWKGDVSKSGGIATNIGIHFFDVLQWIFGVPVESTVHMHTHDRAAGFLQLPQARVRWFLSINNQIGEGRTKRHMTVDGEDCDFSSGFTNLHTESYRAINEGRGFAIEDARHSIQLAHNIRNATPVGAKGEFHPFVKYPSTKHPFNGQ